MNSLRTILPITFALCLSPLHAAETDQRQVVRLKIYENAATVAGLLTTTMRGKTGFNLPLIPRFTHHSWYQVAPKKMLSFPMFQDTASGRITTTGVDCFLFVTSHETIGKIWFKDMLKHSHPEMTQKELKEHFKIYKENIKDCIKAHKEWYANPSDENLSSLQKKENLLAQDLELLDLRQPIVRGSVEELLSLPQEVAVNSKKISLFNFTTNTVELALKPHNFPLKHTLSIMKYLLFALTLSIALEKKIEAPMMKELLNFSGRQLMHAALLTIALTCFNKESSHYLNAFIDPTLQSGVRFEIHVEASTQAPQTDDSQIKTHVERVASTI